MYPPVFLGLGSNLGDREATLAEALRRLAARGFLTRLRSSDWLTEPVGGPPQGFFLNAVVAGETSLEPAPLLAACLAIERELGRVRTVRNGPRTIDVDILFHGDAAGSSCRGSWCRTRAFTSGASCWRRSRRSRPSFVHPVLGKTATELLALCPDRSEVRRQPSARAEGR